MKISIEQILWSMELIYLAGCTRSDVQMRLISVYRSILFAVFGTVLWLRCDAAAVPNVWMNLCPGAFAMVIAWMSRGAFGMGDAWMVLVSGVLLGYVQGYRLFWRALLFGGICGIGCILQKKKKTDSFPFAPCMLLADMVGIWSCQSDW